VTIGLSPIVVDFGPVAIRWAGLFGLLGLGLAVWLTIRQAQRAGVRAARSSVLDALAWGLPLGIVTARLVHLLGWWDYYLTRSAELWQAPHIDGLALWGGLVGGALIVAARLRRDPTRRRRVLDAAAPAALIGIAVGRLGEFLEGQGQGVPTDLPWGTQYSDPLAATPDFGLMRHPAQLYDALAALLIAVVVLRVPRSLSPGTRAALALVLYGAVRIALGGVRLEPAFLFGLQLEQLLAAGTVICGVWFGVRPRLRRPLAAVARRPEERDPLAA
jgi:phosphatidylglycerol:prolipoprotein diacylglycerol transferase